MSTPEFFQSLTVDRPRLDSGVEALVREACEEGAAIVGVTFAPNVAELFESVDDSGESAGAKHDLGGEFTHPHAPIGSVFEGKQDVIELD